MLPPLFSKRYCTPPSPFSGSYRGISGREMSADRVVAQLYPDSCRLQFPSFFLCVFFVVYITFYILFIGKRVNHLLGLTRPFCALEHSCATLPEQFLSSDLLHVWHCCCRCVNSRSPECVRHLLALQGWSTIRYPLKNLSLLIKLENESLYGIFDSAVRCKSTFRSEPLWSIFDFGPPLPV